MRFFEILACGTFLLTDRIQGNGLEQLGFKEGTHYVAYSSFKELFEKVRFYLENEREREQIACMGHQVTAQGHTYAIRLKQLLERESMNFLCLKN